MSTATEAPPAAGPVIVDTTRSPHARLRPVAVSAVRLADAFWAPRRAANRAVTIPSQHRQCEQTQRVDNFRRAAGKPGYADRPFVGIYFNDSDVYKWLEAAAWELAADPDAELAAKVDAVVAEVEAAQQPDGYLNTYYTFDRAAERWSNLKDMHELYCAGHLVQAAVAHYRATGGTRLLGVARRLCDHIDSVFGPASEGKRPGACGHPELEMALVELARATGEPRYAALARHMVDVRGGPDKVAGGGDYHQDKTPVREQSRMVGHAVRHVYLNCGAADLVAETGDAELRAALERQWRNMVGRQLYVSGGIGPRWEGEAFGRDFELPSERAYTETCAAIGSVMWGWRMLLAGGDARYADLIEWQLYNAVMPGLSLDAAHYFYQNPLADDGTHRRQAWFGCACCPPNVARLLAQLPGYAYAIGDDETVHVNLYAAGSAELTLPRGRVVRVAQRTEYPWDGTVELRVETAGEFAMAVRVPAWCEAGARIEVAGRAWDGDVRPGSYARVRRAWRAGDVVRLTLPMAPRRIACHPYVAENVHRVALARGPLLYCAEGVDHPGVDLRDLILPDDATVREARRPDLLGGVVVLTAEARVATPPDEDASLYRTVRPSVATGAVGATSLLTAVPYYAWANRDPGRMQVWLRTR